MKVVCLSASNIEKAKNQSTSTRTCEMVRDILFERLKDAPEPDLDVEIVRLIDYEPVPCRMRGECFYTGWCAHDDAFNQIYAKLVAADAVFIVSPHYAPIPSKLVMIFEKLEEMVYLRSQNDPNYIFPLHRKPVGVIGHGGQTEEAVSYYKSALLDPIATVLTAVQMQVVGANEKWPYGVAFGIQDIVKTEDSIFVKIDHDWDLIRERIRPLVYNVYAQAKAAQRN